MPEILEIRRSIRKEKLALREAIPAHERLASSIIIAEQTFKIIQQEGWKCIHSYLAFRSEVSTNPIIEHLLESGAKIIVPWVEDDGELSHHQLLGLEGFSQGPYGLPHPARNEFTALEEIDAVLLPLAAFDRTGNRLGYGKGFYDKFLAKLPKRTRRIGLAFAVQEARSIPAMEHDQKLDMVVTEEELITVPQ